MLVFFIMDMRMNIGRAEERSICTDLIAQMYIYMPPQGHTVLYTWDK